ncbi:Uncharacterised protein [Mycolicibacterium vanbaalenii]|uniref:DUF7196 domain-containing protein n=1 Tax=Mycolicibacterium vanbaalenii TaxID=110539 RepID=A0A5S9R9M3_MYCVN|nr:Uncharacterised protein [Mycolicibacterium vanbaalenii]
MGCNCRGSKSAGQRTASGREIAGYQLIFPAGSGMESVTYSTPLEAKNARHDSGIVGSTIQTLYR